MLLLLLLLLPPLPLVFFFFVFFPPREHLKFIAIAHPPFDVEREEPDRTIERTEEDGGGGAGGKELHALY